MNIIEILLFLSALPILFILFITVKIYLARRKYKHIPGPPTKGFILIFKNQFELFLFLINYSLKESKSSF